MFKPQQCPRNDAESGFDGDAEDDDGRGGEYSWLLPNPITTSHLYKGKNIKDDDYMKTTQMTFEWERGFSEFFILLYATLER